MPRKKKTNNKHTGQTTGGNTRDIKVERIDKVTIYRRGNSYSIYYREEGKTVRRKIDGNLAVARATARQVATSLAENRATPLGFTITPPADMVAGFLDHCDKVKNLAIRTLDRYRAALQLYLDFCEEVSISSVDKVTEITIEDFVVWLRGQKRTRNGANTGRKEKYATGGIKFILCTCRTAYNWAKRRRMLPPYSENPFTLFPIDQLKDAGEEPASQIFTPQQEEQFFAACDGWQKNIFSMLAIYGMRVGELTHLLVEDVDFETGTISIQPRPWLRWNVKTGRKRQLQIIPQSKAVLTEVIGKRKAGFVFINRQFSERNRKTAKTFSSDKQFRSHIEKLCTQFRTEHADATDKQELQHIAKFARQMGQIPTKRLREEFMKVTAEIGCPEMTRVHDLRHLFSSRAQEQGINVLLVQEMLGHSTLEMTKKYTHIGMEAKRQALNELTKPSEPGNQEG